MKTGYIVLFTLLGIALTITTGIMGFIVVGNLRTPKYEYLEGEYTADYSLIIGESLYVEISEDNYNKIHAELLNQGVKQIVDEFIIKIEYSHGSSVRKYNIYGDKDKENRILLKGQNAGLFDSNRPDFYFCRIDMLYSNLELTEYQYIIDGYTIVGDGVIYKEVDMATFENIKDEFKKQNIIGFPFLIVGKISYNYEEEWKLILHGNLEQNERIFLIGKERYAYYDKDYPEVYYCREDILNLFYEMNGSLDGVELREYMK